MKTKDVIKYQPFCRLSSWMYLCGRKEYLSFLSLIRPKSHFKTPWLVKKMWFRKRLMKIISLTLYNMADTQVLSVPASKIHLHLRQTIAWLLWLRPTRRRWSASLVKVYKINKQNKMSKGIHLEKNVKLVLPTQKQLFINILLIKHNKKCKLNEFNVTIGSIKFVFTEKKN